MQVEGNSSRTEGKRRTKREEKQKIEEEEEKEKRKRAREWTRSKAREEHGPQKEKKVWQRGNLFPGNFNEGNLSSFPRMALMLVSLRW